MTLWSWILTARGYRARRAVRLSDAHQLFTRAVATSRAILQEALGRPSEAVALWTEARDLYARMNLQAGVAESTEHLSKLKA